jgi:hypothetical protein
MLGKLCFDCVPSRKEYDFWISEPVLEWILDDFGFMLDLEYADFDKTLESDRAPPKAITYSDVNDFDGSSYVHICL